jgi:hypothetical protein
MSMSQLQSAVLDRISEIPPEIPLGPVYASGAARTTARRGPASDYTEPTDTSDNLGVGLPMELIHLRHLGMVFGSSRQPSRQAAPWIPPQRAHSWGSPRDRRTAFAVICVADVQS